MRPSPLERLLLLWRLFEPPNLPELPRRNCFLRAFAGDESTATGGESAGTRISRSSKLSTIVTAAGWMAGNVKRPEGKFHRIQQKNDQRSMLYF